MMICNVLQSRFLAELQLLLSSLLASMLLDCTCL
uniref:Uncharacterized protein n=1 Tax=Rhizophora mucronata TaxID=61149 RepID=A0A2P2N8I0_RHIMU